MSAAETGISPRQTSLWQARAYSGAALQRLRAPLEACFSRAGLSVVTAVAGGSLGRLEASAVSDVDLIVLVDAAAAPCCGEPIVELAQAFTEAGLRAPKADGIYGRPISLAALLDQAARGSLSESPALFGSRIQLLLDGRAVCRPEQFVELREAVLQWYADGPDAQSWTHLFNDLSRYLHAYAGWQQFKYTRSADDGWLLRQAKFRSSRIVTFAALLFLLAEQGRQAAGDAAWLLPHLDKTPLDRLLYVFAQYDDFDAAQFLADYAVIHARLADPDIRRELVDASPGAAGDAIDCAAYTEIHALSDSLMNELTRFVLARRFDWPLKIFRNWLL
jgi:hypothetical protein